MEEVWKESMSQEFRAVIHITPRELSGNVTVDLTYVEVCYVGKR